MGKQLTIQLRNVGPHGDLSLTFKEGVNILTGKNGAGKSTAISAVTASFGAPANVTIRDGHHTGTVTVDGVVTLQLGKRLTRNGHPTVEMGGFGPIGEIIQPGIKDPEKADAATIKAILAMAPVDVNEEAIRALTGGDAELMAIPLPADAPNNILAVAEHFRRRANEKALEKEKETERFKGAADAASAKLAELPLPQSSVLVSAEVASAAARSAVEKSVQIALLANQRKEAVERHERIRATLGEMPDEKAAFKALEDAKTRMFEARARVNHLRDEWEQAKKEEAGEESAVRHSEKELATVSESILQWRRQADALQEPITGPLESDVETARAEAAKAQEVAQAAGAQEARKKVQDECGAALMALEQARERGKVLRELAQGVSEALGVVLGRAGLDGFEVEDKRLYCRAPGTKERMLFAERFSFGQRTKVALSIALKAYAGRVVPVDPAFWASLDPSNQKQMDALAKAEDVILVTEQPGDGETIEVARVQ